MDCAECERLSTERERLVFLYVVALFNLRAAADASATPDMVLKMVLDEAKLDLDRAQTELMQHQRSHTIPRVHRAY